MGFNFFMSLLTALCLTVLCKRLIFKLETIDIHEGGETVNFSTDFFDRFQAVIIKGEKSKYAKESTGATLLFLIYTHQIVDDTSLFIAMGNQIPIHKVVCVWKKLWQNKQWKEINCSHMLSIVIPNIVFTCHSAHRMVSVVYSVSLVTRTSRLRPLISLDRVQSAV